MPSSKVFLYCFFITAAAAYDVGVVYRYSYETTVDVSEECNDEATSDLFGHKIKADIHLTAVWQDPNKLQQKLMKIQVPKIKFFVPKKSTFEERKSELQKVPGSESFFLFENNRVTKFWDDPNEHSILRNLKRSVASLLQMKRKDVEEKELDVSGTCDVLYKVEGNTVRRSKRNCLHPARDAVSSQPFGVRSSTVLHSTGIDCNLKSDSSNVVSKCLARERVKTFSNLWKKSSICVHSASEFLLKDTSSSKIVFKSKDLNSVIDEIKKSEGKLIEGDLLAITKHEDEQATHNIIDSTKSFQESLKTAHLAKLKSASAFFKLLPIYRSASKEDIAKVLGNKKFSPILPQILDLLAAASTESSVHATLGFFEKAKGYDENLERYLVSLSVSPRPESFLLRQIQSLLEKKKHHEKIEATLVSTLGALLKTYSKYDKVDTKLVAEALDYLEESLKKCKSDACVLIALRGLRNAGQPHSIPLLLEYAMKGGKPALESLLAVRNMPFSQLSQESQQLLQKIFHQVGVKQDRSSRAAAAEILLRGNSEKDVLKSILSSLSDQTDAEFSTFVVSKLFRLMEEDEELGSKIMKILSEKNVGHYYSLSQKGKSSLFKRHLLDTDSLNVTYGIEMELLQGGLLKRSSFDVEMESDGAVSNLLSVGMFAEGMASFAGDSSSVDEEADPTAGMELTFLGTSLRPYVFFSSTSELMGHAWSGTASEPTPALQGIFSLSDDHHAIVLHNGMTSRLELRAVMSTDLSGCIQISLWNRNSQSQVKNAAALLQKGSAIIEADVLKTRAEYLLYGQSAIEFSTDLDFYESPFKMCLQMGHPNLVLRHDFQKSVEMTETKFSTKKTKKRKKYIPSRSYALHQNNNELCRIMKN